MKDGEREKKIDLGASVEDRSLFLIFSRWKMEVQVVVHNFQFVIGLARFSFPQMHRCEESP
jgi:hypothetical protein